MVVARPCLSLAIAVHLSFVASAFLSPNTPTWQALAAVSPQNPKFFRKWVLRRESPTGNTQADTLTNGDKLSSADKEQGEPSSLDKQLEQNTQYVLGLLNNLTKAVDKWIISGSPEQSTRAQNILKQVDLAAMDSRLVQQAVRMLKRAGMPVEMELGKTDGDRRREEASARKEWEQRRTDETTGGLVANQIVEARSALSNRTAANGKPDLFLSSNGFNLDPQTFAKDKVELQKTLNGGDRPSSSSNDWDQAKSQEAHLMEGAAVKSSELVARAGVGFDGETMGIGGLDDVLAQVKRRIWVPLAAPPQLLHELGIHPVRGLLLYGMPGCGKTLLARMIGRILSPARPITVVSGPEIMDKFVGSSEKNLREVFDNPPDIYDTFRLDEADGGEAMAKAALHVIIMDEFDAMARTRGGRGGKGDQGDAGVARDSVVNQLLAKMDGVDALAVPTLVIGMTNKRSLIEPALLRSGRFEVQIEVPPPRTPEQRISILKVHTKKMFAAGRLLVADAPLGTAAARHIERFGSDGVPGYNDLLDLLAEECEGMSGASLAGVARAAASHALERAVVDFSAAQDSDAPSMMDCLVTQDDFQKAVGDVFESSGDEDWEGAGEETADAKTASS